MTFQKDPKNPDIIIATCTVMRPCWQADCKLCNTRDDKPDVDDGTQHSGG